MLFLILGVIAAIAMPYIVRRWYVGATREIYDGPAVVLNSSALGSRSVSKTHDFLHVEVPGHGSMLLHVTKARCNMLGRFGVTNVVVTLRKGPFGKPFIATVVWPGQYGVENAGASDGSLFLSGWYLLLGVGSLILFADYVKAGGLESHLVLYGCALILALAGYTLQMSHGPKPGDISGQPSRFLGIPLGNGMTGLLVMTAVCVALNAALFWAPSLLLLVGLNTAFAMGGCFALLQRVRRA